MIQNDMFERAKARRDSMIYDAKTYDELKEIATTKDGGFTKINWCGDVACENKIKDDFGIKSRCLIEDEEVTDHVLYVAEKLKQDYILEDNIKNFLSVIIKVDRM